VIIRLYEYPNERVSRLADVAAQLHQRGYIAILEPYAAPWEDEIFDVAVVLDNGPAFPTEVFARCLAEDRGLVVIGPGPVWKLESWDRNLVVLHEKADTRSIVSAVQDLIENLENG
jgi:hypothetical protein